MIKQFTNLLLILLCVLASATVHAQVTFQQVYPSNTYDRSSNDVIATSDGGYLIAGLTATSLQGDTNIFMVKTDYLGDTIWTRSFGGPLRDAPNSVVATYDGNYFVAGYTENYGAGSVDGWLLKIDPNGNLLWWNTYGGTGNDEIKQIIATTDGNYMMVGRMNSPGAQWFDAWLVKIDPYGTVLWQKLYGGPQYETARSVKEYPGGGYVLTGQTESYGVGGDIYLVRTDAVGDTIWTKTYGGANSDDGNGVVANSDGSIVLVAETNSFGAGMMDVQAIKTDANGSVLWNKTYGGTDKDVSKTIYPTSDGGYIVGAISRSFGWINPDMWLLKLDAMGDTTWTRHYGSWDHEHCMAAKQTADGGYIATGHTRSYGPVVRIMLIKLDVNGLPGSTGIEELADNANISLYPNPGSGVFQVRIKNGVEKITSYKISNPLGQVISSGTWNAGKSDNRTVDLTGHQPGLYLLSVQSGNEIGTRKFVLN